MHLRSKQKINKNGEVQIKLLFFSFCWMSNNLIRLIARGLIGVRFLNMLNQNMNSFPCKALMWQLSRVNDAENLLVTSPSRKALQDTLYLLFNVFWGRLQGLTVGGGMEPWLKLPLTPLRGWPLKGRLSMWLTPKTTSFERYCPTLSLRMDAFNFCDGCLVYLRVFIFVRPSDRPAGGTGHHPSWSRSSRLRQRGRVHGTPTANQLSLGCDPRLCRWVLQHSRAGI